MRALTAGELMAPPRRRSQRMHPPLQPPRKCDATASRASSSPTAAWRSASSPCRISSPAWAPRTLRRGRWRTPCLAGSSCARPRPRIAAAARAMTERRSRSLVAARRSAVLTGFDLLALWDDGAGAQTVADVMRPPLTIAPGATHREAADLMLRHVVHRLLVVADPDDGNGTTLGLISASDIVPRWPSRTLSGAADGPAGGPSTQKPRRVALTISAWACASAWSRRSRGRSRTP